MKNLDIEAEGVGGTPLPLLAVLLGPTASGKTALSLHLAERFSGEIVSCDSVAVYREMEIGTAKPTLAERRRIPHHLIDVADPSEAFTAGDYSRLARAALAGITARKKLPIVTGGTGLYLRALIDGLFPAPQRSEEIRRRLRTRRSSQRRKLAAPNPHPPRPRSRPTNPSQRPAQTRPRHRSLPHRRPANDPGLASRTQRAPGLSNPPHRTQPRPQSPLRPHQPPRSSNVREGLVEETRELAEKYGVDARPLTSLGYRQALATLKGEMTLAEAITSAQQGHRNYAKRQMTWFRREPEVHWLNGFGDKRRFARKREQIIASTLDQATPEH